MAADLLIPPLSLFGVMLFSTFLLSALWFLIAGTAAPVVVSSVGVALLALALAIGWMHGGRDLLSARDLGRVPTYALTILFMALRYALGKRSTWVRSDRQ